MLRHLRILRLFWSAALAAEMEYRANFIMAAAGSIMMLVGTLYGLRVLFQSGYQPGGWTYAEALLPVGLYFLIDGFADSVLRPNLSRIVEYVRDGAMDFVLLKPVDAQFWLSLRNCAPWGAPTMIMGAGVVVVGGLQCDPALTWGDFAMGLAPIMLALIVLYALWFMLGTLTIWFVKLYNITEALRSMLEAGKFPVGAYEPAWRVIFSFIIPVAFMTTVPAEVMLGRQNITPWLAGLVALAVGLFALSRWFFRFALRYYTSASS